MMNTVRSWFLIAFYFATGRRRGALYYSSDLSHAHALSKADMDSGTLFDAEFRI